MSDRAERLRADAHTASPAWPYTRYGRVLAIVRLRATAPLVDVAQALRDGGIRVIEFTLTTPGVLPAIDRCRAHFGAGTVLDVAGAAPKWARGPSTWCRRASTRWSSIGRTRPAPWHSPAH